MGHPPSSAPMEEPEEWSRYTQQQESREMWRSHSWKDSSWLLRTCRNSRDFGNWWLSRGSYILVWRWEEAGVEAQAWKRGDLRVGWSAGVDGLLRAGQGAAAAGICPFVIVTPLATGQWVPTLGSLPLVGLGTASSTGSPVPAHVLCAMPVLPQSPSLLSVTQNSGSLLFLPCYFN